MGQCSRWTAPGSHVLSLCCSWPSLPAPQRRPWSRPARHRVAGIGDVLTAHRKLSDWDRSLLDTTFRLGRNYAPADLRSTRKAGLNGGHKVRSFVLADLRAMAKAARAAGARFAVQSAYRSYATQRVDVLALGHGLRLSTGAPVERPRRAQRTPARDHRRPAQVRRRRTVGRAGMGQDHGRALAAPQRLEIRVHPVLPEGQDRGHVLRQ